MDVSETLDRELITDRAEAVRFWLLGFALSTRATGAIQRELGAIIADDSGSSGNGRHSLAGLTIADFVTELHSPNGGAVGRVKSVGEAALKELRSAIPANTAAARAAATAPASTPTTVVASPPAAPTPSADAPGGTMPPEVAPPARRRGRPKGSGNRARKSAVAPQTAYARGLAAPEAQAMSTAPGDTASVAAAQPKRPRGRPRRDSAPAAAANGKAPTREPQPAPGEAPDSSLGQLRQLWPALHPHARRAIVLYASTLLAEAAP